MWCVNLAHYWRILVRCVISRIVTARLELASAGLRQAGGGSYDAFLTVVSVYAPTVTAVQLGMSLFCFYFSFQQSFLFLPILLRVSIF